jgi:dienelactone hydrolase
MSTTAWTLPGADGQSILGNTHLPHAGEGHGPVGVLIVSHGFKGYKDYGFFPHLAQAAADRGLVAHRFNFSHSGMTNRTETFERPELFERDSWSKQIHDLLAVHRAVAGGQLAGRGLPIIWFGHSRGGLTTILAAARQCTDHPADKPAAVIPVASPHKAGAGFDQQARDLMHRQGYVESPSSRTGQSLRVGLAWLEEMEQDPQAFDPIEAMAAITCPILLIHGETDPTVPVGAAHALLEASGGGPGGGARLETIPDAGHTFNCPNPLPFDAAAPPATQTMVQHVCDFACTAAGQDN